ncbi:MAG: methionyl-tRNA formyltransferase [Neisseriaceae bacterium]
MKIIFAGTPSFAAHILTEFLAHSINVVAVLTRPDQRQGRGMTFKPSEVKRQAQQAAIPVLQPSSLTQEGILAQLRAYQPDLMVVVAYGLILPLSILKLPRYGCINIHASLLPRWRGAAPIQRAIEAGDSYTGISILQMERELDSGPLLASEAIAIDELEDANSLHEKLQVLGARLCLEVLTSAPHWKPIPQPEQGVTYASKLSKEEAWIDWNQTAITINRKIRAFNPFPVAKTKLMGQELKIWQARVLNSGVVAKPGLVLSVTETGIEVATGQDSLLLELLQKPGSKKLPVGEFLRGYSIRSGQLLS